MRAIGSPFMALLIVDQGERRGVVKHGLGQGHPEEETDLHGTQADQLGWEQGQPIVLVAERGGGVWRRSQQVIQERAEQQLIGPPLSG